MSRGDDGKLPTASHPGGYIRETVLAPRNLSVKKAADLLGVGRPALSNLINGNAALSREMSVRLEKAFGVNAEDLLQRQAQYDDQLIRERGKQIALPVYAPGFIQISAARIEDWASRQLSARQALPALLRRLVLTTGEGLTAVDFPAFDNSERPGWDGQVEADAATPWIPSGKSGWEFGCDADLRRKAESDYQARVKSIPSNVRENTTFVFVSPRMWPRTRPSKEAWENAKRAEGKWKDVRALDASDLEQWLEQSIPAQSWMAEKLGEASNGVLTLEQAWALWAKATEPDLPKELFDGAIAVHKATLQNWITQPPHSPLVISANSAIEGLAFTACALESVSYLAEEFPVRALVLQSADALKKATTASSRFIAVVDSPEVETALAGLQKIQHTIIVRGRNIDGNKPDITLGLIDNNTLRTALHTMGWNYHESAQLIRESGQSATVLRRRLSNVPEIKCPPWSRGGDLAKKLIPLMLAGTWNSDVAADREILECLADVSYPTVEKWIAELVHTEQPPVWSSGTHRGTVSKIDALFGIHHAVTKIDLDRFLFAAHYVLAEKDPALELPLDKRWAAGFYGKSRDHSRALRDGILQTLVLLALHGNHLFEDRLGINLKAKVDAIIRSLLTPLDSETWESQQQDLSEYAEAAPDVFLDLLETDLKSPSPQVLSLMRPADSGVFGRCARTSLLFGLEILAWDPTRTLGVSRLLCRLSEPKIEDNWGNKPENSLASIFRSWLPQTAMQVEDRCKILEVLGREFPRTGWRLCIQQFDPHATIGHYSARPRWRNDAAGSGQVVTVGERDRTIMKAIEICLSWPKHNERTLADLIECLRGLTLEHQLAVWELVRLWISHHPTDDAKAFLRERIRRSTLTRRGRLQGLEQQVRDEARAAFYALEPTDPVVRYQWLFSEHWVDESFDELEEANLDVGRWMAKIERLRSEAIKEVWLARGPKGIIRLAEGGNAPFIVGGHLAKIIAPKNAIGFVDDLLMERPAEAFAVDRCIYGLLDGLEIVTRDDVVVELISRFAGEGAQGDAKKVRLFLNSPPGKATWRHVDNLPKPLRDRYWQQLQPHWLSHDRDELREMTTGLIEAKRPRAAFHAVHFRPDELEPPVLLRLMNEVATNGSEPAGHYMLQPHDVARALKVLAKSPMVSRQQMAQLEFLYLSALSEDQYGIPHLEAEVCESPALFMQAIGLSYKRSDDGVDPLEWRPGGNGELASSVATQAFQLLKKARRMPGTEPDGTIDAAKLKSWINEVSAMCKKYAREVVGAHVLGEFLAKCPTGDDGVWPCTPIRQALEELGTKEILEGMVIGAINSRGAVWRGQGGSQERELAAKYRSWSKQLAVAYPVASRLLEQIAVHYDYDAKWHETDADVRRRVSY